MHIGALDARGMKWAGLSLLAQLILPCNQKYQAVIFSFSLGNDDDTFSVNPDTGNVTMKKPVNTQKTFILDVMVSLLIHFSMLWVNSSLKCVFAKQKGTRN